MSEKEYLRLKHLNEIMANRIEYLEAENKKLLECSRQTYSSEDVKSMIKDLMDAKAKNISLSEELKQIKKKYKDMFFATEKLKERLKSQTDEFQMILDLASKNPTIKM